MQIVEHLGEVGAQTIWTILEGGREEAHDIQRDFSFAREDKLEFSLGIVAC